MGLAIYQIVITAGPRAKPFRDHFTADGLVMAIAQAIEAAKEFGIPPRRVRRIDIESRELVRHEV